MSKHENKVPEVRFKGFMDDWEQRKLGDWIAPYTEKTDRNNQYPVLTSSRKGIFLQTDYYKGNQIASEDNTGYNIVPRGYFTYRHMSDDEIFKFNINNIVDYGIVSTLYPVFTTKEGLNCNFLQYQLNNGEEFQRYAILQKQGGSRTYMYLSKLEKLKLTIPELQEQIEIGNFFKQIDETIALHQQKLDKLKQLKKGYMQVMFPSKGEEKPGIRFNNFNNSSWKQCKLGELAEIVRGASPRPIQDPKWFDRNSDIGWLRISDVTEQDGRIHYLEQRISTLSQEKTRVLNEPHLLLSIAATVGKPVVNYVKTGVHDGFLIFKNPNFHQEFMFQWLEMFRPKWQKYGQPGSQVNLNSELVRSQEIKIPSFKEQKKIGKFLKQLDETVALHKGKVEKLQSLKRVFLQKMFI